MGTLGQKEPNIGPRLRAMRAQQGLSLRALATACGLSINAISLLERGINSPTVSTLHRLATAFHVPITAFFQEGNRQTAVSTKRGAGLRIQNNGRVMESLGIGLSSQQLEPFRMVIHPGSGNLSDPIAHPGEEFVHCLEGVLEYWIGDRMFLLEAGDSLLFDATQPHAYHNSSQTPASLLMVFQASQDNGRVHQLHMQ